MKSMKKNRAGFTLIELVVSVAISAVVIFAISSIIIFTAKTVSESGIERGLQIDMNNLAHQITGGAFDPGGIDFGLRGSVSYNIVSSQQVDFTDTIGTLRSFIASGNSLIYSSPTQSPPQNVIYTAPAGSTLNVIFSASSTNNLVNISMSVTRTVGGKTLTGSVVTSVYLRNVS